MRRGSSTKGGGGEGDSKQATSGVALGRNVAIRASRPTDGKHLPRIRQLVEWAREHGEIQEFRSPELVGEALVERRAILAVWDGVVIGFGAATSWDGGEFVSHTAVLVDPDFRDWDLANQIKRRLIGLTRRRWPQAAILGLTLSSRTEELDQAHGIEAVPYCDLTTDLRFWEGCRTCEHYGHLKRNQYQDCNCWAGLLLPKGSKRKRVIPKDALANPRPGMRYRGGA